MTAFAIGGKMPKRRQLKDVMADPLVQKRPSIQRDRQKASSQPIQKIAISILSVIVGAVAGAFLSRYYKIF